MPGLDCMPAEAGSWQLAAVNWELGREQEREEQMRRNYIPNSSMKPIL